jgi:hypothetical protein
MVWRFIKTIFGNNADKRDIPLNTDISNPNGVDYENGLPPITSEPKMSGGLPPKRADFNELFSIILGNLFYLQGGQYPTFDVKMTQSPNNGYANNAILWSEAQVCFVRSTKNNNKDNFVSTPSYIGTSWKKVSVSDISQLEPAFTKNTAFNKNFETTASNIKMNGTSSLGNLLTLPKSDHVHPSDTSREAVHSTSSTSNIERVPTNPGQFHEYAAFVEKIRAQNANNSYQMVFNLGTSANTKYLYIPADSSERLFTVVIRRNSGQFISFILSWKGNIQGINVIGSSLSDNSSVAIATSSTSTPGFCIRVVPTGSGTGNDVDIAIFEVSKLYPVGRNSCVITNNGTTPADLGQFKDIAQLNRDYGPSPKYTQLWNGDSWNTTINLSQAFTNFDALCLIGNENGFNEARVVDVEVFALLQSFSVFSNRYLFIPGYGNRKICLEFNSNNTTVVLTNEGMALNRIYGIKKYITPAGL